jgi:peptide/nickel transport system permease protein
MRNRSLYLVAVLLLALATAPWFISTDPTYQDRAAANAGPSAFHWIGTDGYGRDLWSRFVYGGRWSMGIGAIATLAVLVMGWAAGSWAGFVGGAVDWWVMRTADMFLMVPWLYLLIALRAALPLNLPPRQSFATLLVVIAVASWARPARMVRGLVLSLRQKGYVDAALGFGARPLTVYFRHVLPGTYSLFSAQALLLFPRFVLAEVGLSYMGLGLGEPEPSWGALILPLRQAYLLRGQWWLALPVLLMAPVFLSLAFWAWRLERPLSR